MKNETPTSLSASLPTRSALPWPGQLTCPYCRDLLYRMDPMGSGEVQCCYNNKCVVRPTYFTSAQDQNLADTFVAQNEQRNNINLNHVKQYYELNQLTNAFVSWMRDAHYIWLDPPQHPAKIALRKLQDAYPAKALPFTSRLRHLWRYLWQ